MHVCPIMFMHAFEQIGGAMAMYTQCYGKSYHSQFSMKIKFQEWINVEFTVEFSGQSYAQKLYMGSPCLNLYTVFL